MPLHESDRTAPRRIDRMGGLVRPIRVRLLQLLEVDGPTGVSQLGRRVGESSDTVSYHLRVLVDRGCDRELGTPSKGGDAQRTVFCFQMLLEEDAS